MTAGWATRRCAPDPDNAARRSKARASAAARPPKSRVAKRESVAGRSGRSRSRDCRALERLRQVLVDRRRAACRTAFPATVADRFRSIRRYRAANGASRFACSGNRELGRRQDSVDVDQRHRRVSEIRSMPPRTAPCRSAPARSHRPTQSVSALLPGDGKQFRVHSKPARQRGAHPSCAPVAASTLPTWNRLTHIAMLSAAPSALQQASSQQIFGPTVIASDGIATGLAYADKPRGKHRSPPAPCRRA